MFALISLFVGAFTIFNTFSITVGQRTRELALLRVVGASRRQVFRSVLGEAVVVGLAASLIGLGLGVLAALALKALLGAFGVTLPSAPLVFEARTVVLALAVGIGVTVISAIGPARRAVRIAPVAALVATGEEPAESLRRRVTIGGVAAIGGIAALVAGLTAPAIGLVGLGAMAVFIAAGLLAPIVARPMSSALGRPLGALLGAPGRMGRENSMRSPRRTAQTAAALMVGIALVSAIAVLGASLSRSARTNLESAVTADDIITGPSSGFSTSVAAAVSRIPGVSTVTNVYKGQFELRGSLSSLAAVDPAGLRRTVHLAITAGSGARALAAGQLLIDTTTASAKHLTVGSVVPVTFAQTGASTVTVGGIFKANPLIGSYLVGAGFFVSHFHNPLPVAVLISTQPGAGRVERAINNYLGVYPNVGVQSRAQFEHAQQATVNQELGLVYVLLALADPRRADRDRQHADAVGVRAHPRARPAPSGRDETPPGPDDDPIRSRDHRPVRRRHRHHHRDRARRRVRGLAQTTGHHRDHHPLCQPDRVPGPRCSARAGRRQLAGPPGRQTRCAGGDRGRVTNAASVPRGLPWL